MNVLAKVLLILQAIEAAVKAAELVIRRDLNQDGVIGFGVLEVEDKDHADSDK